jgi:hypothetical protein
MRHGKMLLRLVFTLASLLGSTTSAFAQTPHGVVAGLSIKWEGTAGSGFGADNIIVNTGNGYIDGTAFTYTSNGNAIAIPGGLFGGPVGGLVGSTVWYLYLVCPLNNVNNLNPGLFLTSSVAPTYDGHPNGILVGNCSNSPGNPVVGKSGLFIGSLLTDNAAGNSNPHIVPFARNGDEVLLMPLRPVTTPQGPELGGVGMQSLPYTVPAGGGATCGGSQNPLTFSEFPESATAMLVDARAYSATNSTVFAILQPFLAAQGFCDNANPQMWSAQWESSNQNIQQGQPVLNFSHERILVKTSQSCNAQDQCTAGVYVAQEAAGVQGDNLTVTYVGYLEKIRVLNFF